MAWNQGPLPPETYGRGGVVPRDGTPDIGTTPPGQFHFCIFDGDHASTLPFGVPVEAKDVMWYDNSLTNPPTPERPQPPLCDKCGGTGRILPMTDTQRNRLDHLELVLTDGDCGRFYSRLQLAAMNKERKLLRKLKKEDSHG